MNNRSGERLLTSEDKSEMTKGRELPINSKARRRLFFGDEPESEKCAEGTGEDYLNRVNKTEIARNMRNEAILNGMKWNFDFKNEVALDGPIQWYRKADSGEWVGMQPSPRTENMRKRKMEPESAIKFNYEGERSKETRLSLHAVLMKQSFFNDERNLEYANFQAEDDNFANAIMDEIQPILRTEADVVTLTSEVNLAVAEKEDKEAAEKKADTMKKEDEVGKEINEALSNAITEIDMVVYDNTDVVGEQLKSKIIVTGNGELISEDQAFLPENNHEKTMRISEISDVFQMEEQVGSKEKLNDTVKRKNQVTPRIVSNDYMPPLRKKVSRAQVLRERAKRRISFE